MIAELVAAALIAASPAPTAVPAATPTVAPTEVPSGPPTTPLREVVYRVSSSVRVDDISESYGGYNASAPSSTGLESKSGVVTVDVMAKFENGDLGIRVAETWKEYIDSDVTPRLPQRFSGAVTADGTVEFPLATIDPVTIELLLFFATRITPVGTLAPGTHWTVEKTYKNAVVTTDYSVTAVGQSSTTIHRVTKIQALGYESIDGMIAYDTTSFVPISGKIRMTRNDTFANGQSKQTLDMSFDLVSDTNKPATKP
jgi:hypothetical protein